MDQHFFRIPFAANGDKKAIPETQNAEGYVSFTQGYGPDYASDPTADAHAKPVERESMNFVLNAITGAMRQYQTHGYPQWITTADNNGAAFGYDAGVVVFYNGALYLSLVAANTATPGADATKWQPYIQREATLDEATEGAGSTQVMTPRRVKSLASSLDEQVIAEFKQQIAPVTVPIGGIMLWGTPTPPDGWLECNGQSFSVADNPELYATFPSGRVPDFRGRFLRGWDHGAGVDPDNARVILSTQEDDNKAHEHRLQLIKENANNIPSGSLVQAGISAANATYEIGGANKNDQASFLASTAYTKATSTGGDESRPKNTAVMYIIKTDQAEAEAGEVSPTAIIVSPSTATIQAGGTQQFSATVLPSSIASGYPISWAVSDDSLGSINSAGLYTSTGVSGTQTIIASISTGLASTATVTQHIYLAGINIGAMPSELLVDKTYSIAITFSPANYTENVISTSSDSSVATLATDGTLTISAAGTTTLSLTGALSGVTASVTITATEVVAPEVYLQIGNNLSEIADAGEDAQSEAREHIGLGELATKDSLMAGDVGAVPLNTISLPSDLDLNNLTTPGEYFQNVSSYATPGNHYPVPVAGAVKVIATGVDTGSCRQFYYPYNDHSEWRRFAYGDPLVFSEWSVV